MPQDAVADFPGEVQTFAIFFEHFDDTHALFVVAETARQTCTQRVFAGVPERGMPEVMAERNGLRQVLVQVQASRDRPRHLHHLHGVCQARAVVIADRRNKDLCLMFQSSKRL